MTNPKIEDEEQHRISSHEGYGKQRSIRIGNTPYLSGKGGESKPYEEWTKEELYQLAIKVGIAGRSYMSKKSLIHSLRKN